MQLALAFFLIVPFPDHCLLVPFSIIRLSGKVVCTAKDSHIFSTNNNSVFVTLADICLTNLCLNDIVKLTML